MLKGNDQSQTRKKCVHTNHCGHAHFIEECEGEEKDHHTFYLPL